MDDCTGCGQQMEIIDGYGVCEYCDRKVFEVKLHHKYPPVSPCMYEHAYNSLIEESIRPLRDDEVILFAGGLPYIVFG